MTASDNTDIAIVAVSQTPSYRRYHDSEPRMIMDCVNDLLRDRSVATTSASPPGSCATAGMPFASCRTSTAGAPWPPVY